ncbi:MAG: cyclic nucleotide-binding domain-containing protein [Chitinispirillaceae bacterium]|jgi:CRP-like cAMP-binding protein|nr:cyclic nucleotide-binding domain-containing protein [Chitinispirillaceae bacterium]
MEEQSPYTLLENLVSLKRSALFSGVPTRELEAVAAVVEELRFEPGECIVREGDVGDSLYLIREGSVSITKRISATASTTLAELSCGDCFGEMSAIDEEVRSASVSAKVRCTLLRISKEALLDVILSSPRLGVELLKIFVTRLRAANGKIQKMTQEKSS